MRVEWEDIKYVYEFRKGRCFYLWLERVRGGVGFLERMGRFRVVFCVLKNIWVWMIGWVCGYVFVILFLGIFRIKIEGFWKVSFYFSLKT